jgi:hypothetical protein
MRNVMKQKTYTASYVHIDNRSERHWRTIVSYSDEHAIAGSKAAENTLYVLVQVTRIDAAKPKGIFCRVL